MIGIEIACEGRIGKDPELRTAKSGGTWCSLSIACGGDGEDADTTWISASVFGQDAQVAAQLAKGARVYLEGKLRLSTWVGQDGKERTGLQVACSLLQPLGEIGRRRRSVIRKPPPRKSAEHLSQTYHRPLHPRSKELLNEPLPF